MSDRVHANGGQPLYYSKEFAYTKMNVDCIANYTILYLYSAGMTFITYF